MKIQVFSDLHLEKRKIKLPRPLCKYLILAGDICEIDYINDNLDFFMYVNQNWQKIFYVLGNHEFYSKYHNINYTVDIIRSILSVYPNITIINNEKIQLEDYEILGSTLWSHIEDKYNDNYKYAFKKLLLNDVPINNKIYNKLNEKNINWIKSNYNPNHNTILITHFPTRLNFTTNPMFQNNPYDKKIVYANDLKLIPKNNKKLICIAGHTHYNYRKIEKNTYYYSNQYGDDNEVIDNFCIEGILETDFTRN